MTPQVRVLDCHLSKWQWLSLAGSRTNLASARLSVMLKWSLFYIFYPFSLQLSKHQSPLSMTQNRSTRYEVNSPKNTLKTRRSSCEMPRNIPRNMRRSVRRCSCLHGWANDQRTLAQPTHTKKTKNVEKKKKIITKNY